MRIPIQYLLRDFRRWLVQEGINQIIQNRKTRNKPTSRFNDASNFQIQWIERLIQTGIADGRKETLRLILAPYLIKIKNYNESTYILENWLDKCNKVKELDQGFNRNQRIKQSLRNTKGFLKLDSLKMKYPWLYDIIRIK